MDRKTFISTSIKAGAVLSLSTTILNLSSCSNEIIQRPDLNLIPDPNGICDLPKGFTYHIISKEGERMSDGHIVPGDHDGMACFEGLEGQIILVRNHEISQVFPFDPPSPEPDYAYDPKSCGGTTTIYLNKDLEVVKHYLSLTGTIRNCAGGKTPWNTWISSEEVEPGFKSGWQMGKRHGYNFEVDPLKPIQKAVPLKDMGRFRHEAVAVDPSTSIAYQTEDSMNGCFYRFLPNAKQQFEKGGKLQALKFVDETIKHTTKDSLQLHKNYKVDWVTIDNPDPAENTVSLQAQDKGAAVFVRGEGIIFHTDGIYIACTSGGRIGKGQIFKYTPDKTGQGGEIQLVFEATERGVLEKPDNITTNMWGDLIICEDNSLDTQCLVGFTPKGDIYYIAGTKQAEWAGACFSPDGETLFANIQMNPAVTLAIRGPWESLRNSI